MRIRITIERDAPREPVFQEGPSFALLADTSRPNFRAWLPSVCVHAALVAVASIQSVTQFGVAVAPAGSGAPLRIRLDGKTYLVSSLPRGERLILRSGGTGGNAQRGLNDRGDNPDRAQVSAARLRKDTRHAVVRDDLPPDVATDMNTPVPNLAVWTAHAPTKTPESPVHPGATRPEAASETNPISPVNLVEIHAAAQTSPVRAITSGDVKSLSSAVLVPAGNVANAAAAGAGAAGSGGGATAAAADAAGESSVRTGVGTMDAVAVTLPAAVKDAQETPAQNTVVIRPAANGKFDAVIVQTSGAEIFEGAAGSLSGRPVYTVYLPMGTRKDWILQYCIPKDPQRTPEPQGPVVTLRPESTVEGPWPTLMQRVPVTLPAGQRYMVVHGYVSESGRLERARVLRTGTSETTMAMLQAVSAWQFRPARRDGVPIAVEILLAIPADSV